MKNLKYEFLDKFRLLRRKNNLLDEICVKFRLFAFKNSINFAFVNSLFKDEYCVDFSKKIHKKVQNV